MFIVVVILVIVFAAIIYFLHKHHENKIASIQHSAAIEAEEALKAEHNAQLNRAEELRVKQQATAKLRRENELAAANLAAVAKEQALKKQHDSELAAAQIQAEAEALELKKQHEQEMAEAEAMTLRSISRAETTKEGYVYIISNVGAFGKDILKIGMSRRLDPMERIKELGNASVPFPFDIHAIIPAKDAPELEHKLHKYFALKRVNLVNTHKEYFYTTTKEVEDFLLKEQVYVTFTHEAVADEYRQSVIKRHSATKSD